MERSPTNIHHPLRRLRARGRVVGRARAGQGVGPPRPHEPGAIVVSGYWGLWGLYTRDPFEGEDAPAGPMYNRDKTISREWFDPVGWAGLDKVPTRRKSLRS